MFIVATLSEIILTQINLFCNNKLIGNLILTTCMAKNGSSQYIKNDDIYTWFICVILYGYFVLNKSSPYSTVC